VDGGLVLDRTVFYARGGGQPGDTGVLRWDGGELTVLDTFRREGRVVHVVSGDDLPGPGTPVEQAIDWERRYRLMRMHSALHLLSVVLPFGVTGGSIGEDKGRLDFDMPEPPENVAALEAQLNEYVAAGLPVTAEWITDEELAAQPEMVKTMKVKPPVGQGRVRLIRIGSGGDTLDLQPCGGTHVRNIGEIGAIKVLRIRNEGRHNKRVEIAPA
jgi:misacylated tRNA(Ala) deacylase